MLALSWALPNLMVEPDQRQTVTKLATLLRLKRVN